MSEEANFFGGLFVYFFFFGLLGGSGAELGVKEDWVPHSCAGYGGGGEDNLIPFPIWGRTPRYKLSVGSGSIRDSPPVLRWGRGSLCWSSVAVERW